jgi:hypothetical protein
MPRIVTQTPQTPEYYDIFAVNIVTKASENGSSWEE